MKKIGAFLLGILMMLSACTALADTLVLQPGDQQTLEVSIAGASGEYAKIGIRTNDAPVTFVSATGGSVNDTVPPRAFDDYFDVVNLDGASISADGTSFSGSAGNYSVAALADGMVGKLTFQVNANAAAGTYTVEVYRKAGSGEVTGSVTFEVKESQTSGDRLPGDVDDSGDVNLFDVIVLNRYLAGWDGVTINESNADVDGSGDVNLFDVIVLNRYLAGWEDVVLK